MAIEPASAVTSPSLTTSNGTPPHSLLRSKKMRRMRDLEIVGRHAAEERGHAHFVVHINARGAAADGVHARQVRGGALQRVVDAVEVILRVALEIRIPRRFPR